MNFRLFIEIEILILLATWIYGKHIGLDVTGKSIVTASVVFTVLWAMMPIVEIPKDYR